ncbi:MAG: ribonuclease H-like domain-containing protein [Bacteroidota bacterium]
MSRIVFDIETLGYKLETFDQEQQDYLLKFAEGYEGIEEAKQKLSLYALTAQVISIAIVNPDTGQGKVLFQSDTKEEYYSDDNKFKFESGDEKFILSEFWNILKSYDQFITFNGRGFDAPFLILRSAILSIPTTKNLMPYRYDHKTHCDLLEQLTFFGATRKFNLDFFCKAFGIESPKSHGVTGLDMRQLFEEKRFREIASYCLGDTLATASLFKSFEENILGFQTTSHQK